MSRARGFGTARRNELARERGFSGYAQQRRYGSMVTNESELVALPPAAQEVRQRSLDALSVARREGVDVAAAARREGVSIDAVRFWAGDAVTRSGGRWRAAAGDRLFRPMFVYSAGRVVALRVRGSKAASTIGRYHAAIAHYLATGDESRLAAFRGVRVGGVELETDLDVLDELARRGEFSFESIYRAAG